MSIGKNLLGTNFQFSGIRNLQKLYGPIINPHITIITCSLQMQAYFRPSPVFSVDKRQPEICLRSQAKLHVAASTKASSTPKSTYYFL